MKALIIEHNGEPSALVYSAAEVRGWLIFSWLARKGVSEGSEVLRILFDRMVEGSLKLPAARLYSLDRAFEAFTDAELAGHDAKPLLAFS